ncbi:hypothetical protein HPB48_008643 [Haemaphysalis longicornis]|uniref:Uncharacterized protein n=1 Tax=Haemaphysalis longicornis TaxID=44386 RepID=A0A9J6H5Q9_HAELO|nr:hypothetical protein HPB48_008643 [Haemaphysalis longicornis]
MKLSLCMSIGLGPWHAYVVTHSVTWPNSALQGLVCGHCGRMHEEDKQCEETPFCVACQAAGHISLDPTCPTRAWKTEISSAPKKTLPAKAESRELASALAMNAGTPFKSYSQVTALNTAVNNSKTEARSTCVEHAQVVPAGALSKLQQQMESFIQQKFEAMQKQIMSWMQDSQGQPRSASNQPSANRKGCNFSWITSPQETSFKPP